MRGHLYIKILGFGATVCKTVRPIYGTVLSVLFVTLVYCGLTVDGSRCHLVRR